MFHSRLEAFDFKYVEAVQTTKLQKYYCFDLEREKEKEKEKARARAREKEREREREKAHREEMEDPNQQPNQLIECHSS